MATPLLYLAWRGGEDDGGLYWATFDGKVWTSQSTQSDRASLTGPTLAVHGGRLFMAWRGVTDDYGIYWSTYDARSGTWSPQLTKTDRASYSRPELVSFKGHLWMAWRSASDDSAIFWATYDENLDDWGPQNSHPFGCWTGPALAAYRGKLYMAWIDPGFAPNISWSIFDEGANSWIGKPRLTDRGSHDGPALVVFGGRLYMVWRGIVANETDEHVYRSVYDDSSGNWSPQEQMVPPQPPGNPPPPLAVGWMASRVRPALFPFQNCLYMACVGQWTFGPSGGPPDQPGEDTTGIKGSHDPGDTPGGEAFPPDLRLFYAVSPESNIVPYPVPNWMTLIQDSAGHDFLTGGWPALAVYAEAPGSLRNFLLTRGFEPNRGIREFVREFWPEVSSVRTLMRS